MQTKRLLTLVPVILTCAALAAQPAQGANEQKQALGEMRNIGTALFAWLTDQDPKPSGDDRRGKDADIDLGAIPVISHADLAKLLVPLYLAQLPVNDPWGKPYEFRLNRDNLGGVPVMAIRSAGKDGTFSGTVYTMESFAISDQDQDLVWVDGFFARWPEGKK
jgi:hypothetical protein